MLRNYHTYILFFLIGLIPITIHSQDQLNFGLTKLESKPIVKEKDNITCIVTPQITYSQDNPNLLKVVLNAKWKDKDNIEIEGGINDCYLYLIENYNEINDKDRPEILDPKKIDQIKRIKKSIVIYENQKEISSTSFIDPYLKFDKSSPEIAFKITSAVGNDFTLKVDFTYVRKGKVRDFNVIKNWPFTISPNLHEPDLCKEIENQYKNDISSVNPSRKISYFTSKLEHANVDISKFEQEFKEYLYKIKLLNELKDKVASDKELIKCKEIGNKLISEIKRLIPSESEIEQINQKIDEIKNKENPQDEVVKVESKPKEKTFERKAAKDLSAEIDKVVKKYEIEYAVLDSKLGILKYQLAIDQSDLVKRIENNEKHIIFAQQLNSRKEELKSDSVIVIQKIIDSVNIQNNLNIDLADSILLEIRRFKSNIETTSDNCKSELQNIDKILSENGKIILNKFSELWDSSNSIEQNFEDLFEQININNGKIMELIGVFDERGTLIQVTKNQFDSIFNNLLIKLELQQIVFNEIIEDFESKKFSRWYFKWVRSNLLSDVIYLESSHDSVKSSFDSISREKSLAFKEFNFNPQIESQQDFEKIETGFEPRIITLKTKIEDSVYEPFPYFYLILAIILVSILIFGLRVYFKAIKKKIDTSKVISQPEKPAVSSIKLQHTGKKNEDTGRGLAFELEKSKSDFLELDLSYEWENSSVSKIYFHKDCIIKTYRFFEDSIRSVETESKANETGGYLIGQWDLDTENPEKYDVSLEDFIEPGDDATFSKYQLNFGAKIGVKLQKVLDNFRQKTERDFVMTAWFHSHPGLKIFLSDYDISVQEDFARNNHKYRMLALVLDPYTPNWDLGIFSYKTDGKMNNAVDSKRFFSFDNIYQWALKQDKNLISEKIYSYNLFEKYPESDTKRIYVSNPGILAIKRYLEDKKLNLDKKDKIAFLLGNKIVNDLQNIDILIEGIIESDQEQIERSVSNSNIVGFLFCTSCFNSDSGKLLMDKIKMQNEISEKIQIAILYDLEEEMIVFHPFVKDFEKDLQKLGTAKILLPELVDWTRKR